MDLQGERSQKISNYLKRFKIARLDDLKSVVGSGARMTVLRALNRLDYISSYSHRGQYYTLRDIPDFNELGLWSFESVRFSKLGNLLTTAEAMVDIAEAGYCAKELEGILHVEVRHALLQLHKMGKIYRCKSGRHNVYMSMDKGRQRQQRLWRKDRSAGVELGQGVEVDVMADELKAAIILFFSLLNEQQRRLYAGLEALKIGYGGDRIIAQLLGLDVHTIAKGRKELVEQNIDRSNVRQEGGGRSRVEKKILK